jgi:hypothetical protein
LALEAIQDLEEVDLVDLEEEEVIHSKAVDI